MAGSSTNRKSRPQRKPSNDRPHIRVDLASAMPRYRWGKRIVFLCVVSLLVHFVSFKELVDFGARNAQKPKAESQNVTIRMIPREELSEQKMKKILEAKQEKTERPKQADHLGEVDHLAKKETRVDTTKIRDKALDPGRTIGKKTPDATKPKTASQKTNKAPKSAPKMKLGMSGQQSVYSSLMPTAEELSKQVDAGYVGFVNDKVALGDAIDINTTEFRFIGYFTNLRKAIELVWNYPYDAAVRGMQGSVGLVFTINKDGSTDKIKVVSSSGYKILDQAIVDAVTLASPFAPLPASFKKDKLTIKGNFTYTLGNMIGGY
jgi:protein TonB